MLHNKIKCGRLNDECRGEHCYSTSFGLDHQTAGHLSDMTSPAPCVKVELKMARGSSKRFKFTAFFSLLKSQSAVLDFADFVDFSPG